MRTSALTIAAVGGQLAPVMDRPGCRVDHARVASALSRYEQSQSAFAIIPEPARHAVLEIGDRMHGLREALRSVEPGCGGDLGTDGASESLIAFVLREAVDPCLAALSREMEFGASALWRAASRCFHERFGVLVDLSPVAARCLHKPLGYAGDFEMMNMIYRNESLGDTLFGRSLSRAMLDSDAARAVRCRAHYLMGKIKAAVARGGHRGPTRILSVAAGPAMELQLILCQDPALLASARTQITLLDQDADALKHACERIEALAAQAHIDVTVRSISTSIRTVIAGGLPGSYDLVYSAGLFDYLKDGAVRPAAARLVGALAPGGNAIIGNFDIANPTRPLMELILDWPLYHRSADDLRRLFSDLGTGMTIERDATGINMFAMVSA